MGTLHAARERLKKLDLLDKLVYVKDPQKGKPFALNLLFKKAKGKYWILTDGDVYTEPGAAAKIVKYMKYSPEKGAVSSRPISAQNKNNFWSYVGNVLADGAHHARDFKITKKKRILSCKWISILA